MPEEHPGIYVAFDANGRHYEYIRHPATLPKFLQKEQEEEVVRARKDAVRIGGDVRLVTLEWFDENVVKDAAA